MDTNENTANRTILVVDDDDLTRAMVAHLLEREGYRVLKAADGASALTLYADEKPDLVVLDIAMPHMSGMEVAARLRKMQREQGRRVPIIVLTAYARSFSASGGGGADVDSFLTKPILPVKLLRHVHQFLGGAPSQKGNSSTPAGS